MELKWMAFNPATDDDGCALEAEACWDAELAWLRIKRCRDVESAKLIGVEITGRSESAITADVSEAMAR
jgi:hypothetical protein